MPSLAVITDSACRVVTNSFTNSIIKQYTGIGLMWFGTKIIAPSIPGVAKTKLSRVPFPYKSSFVVVFLFGFLFLYTQTDEITTLTIVSPQIATDPMA